MANRQVRLDEDVVALVQAQADEWGSTSLSATANRMLRAHTATARAAVAPQAARTPVPAAAPPRAARGTVKRPGKSTKASPAAARERARVSARSCEHPVSRRIGDHCAICFQKV